MAITVREFGVTKSGEKASLYTMTNENGMRVSVSDFGATLVSVLVPDRDGQMADVVLGYDAVADYEEKAGHFGATVGRNANRIAGAAFLLGDRRIQLSTAGGINNLHSGPDYYGKRFWEAQAEEGSLGSSVEFSLFSPDGDQGFPGNADITVVYTLTADNALMISYHGVCDQDTVMNMTNHSYFNLAGHDSGTVLDQEIWLDSDYFTAADEASIPTGEIRPVKGTPMDFTVPKPIGRDIGAEYDALIFGKGYDHNWVLKTDGEQKLVARLTDPVSGRVMEVYTDLPGVQIYTGNFVDTVGKNGAKYDARSGVCFETQYYPDSVNKPEFPSPVVKAGEEYDTVTVYKFL